MKCNVHTSRKSPSRYLIVPEARSVASLPPQVVAEFDTPSWKTIKIENRLIGLNSSEAKKDIIAQGYHIALTEVLFEEDIVP